MLRSVNFERGVPTIEPPDNPNLALGALPRRGNHHRGVGCRDDHAAVRVAHDEVARADGRPTDGDGDTKNARLALVGADDVEPGTEYREVQLAELVPVSPSGEKKGGGRAGSQAGAVNGADQVGLRMVYSYFTVV